MRYLSVCSGIEAATVAWHPLGWTPAGFAEIEPFPSAVLAHHYGASLPGATPDRAHRNSNTLRNFGDFTRIDADAVGPVDLLVGGTPCQSFSVAGLRAGLDDERGNLALEFCRLARRLGPRWVVWENVPGVLSLDGGRAFASILGGLAECGYGLAYRVLDAQFVRVDGFGRALPQRRRRVFVVGHLGDWRRAAAVLFERASLRWDSPPGRATRQEAAQTPGSRTQSGGECRKGGQQGSGATEFDGDVGRDVLPAMTTRTGTGPGRDGMDDFIVAHALRGRGFDAGEDGTACGTPLVPAVAGTLSANDGAPRQLQSALSDHLIAFDETQITSLGNRSNPQPGDPSHPIAAGNRPPTIAFHARQIPDSGPVTPTLDTDGGTVGIFAGWRVRRLTPVECERLQGFPDGYTAIRWRGKPAADGPRYKALGNSMAVNVMRWIGQRIAAVDQIAPLHGIQPSHRSPRDPSWVARVDPPAPAVQLDLL